VTANGEALSKETLLPFRDVIGSTHTSQA